jgi:hypothetical protein
VQSLIYLCPNHHTKYDLGFKPASNLTQEEVVSAKRLKQNSRRRILRYEANATKSLQSLISFIKGIEESLSKEHAHNIQSIYVTEMQNLISTIPELSLRSEEEARKDKLVTAPEKEIAKIAPKLAALASAVSADSSENEVRSKAQSLITQTKEILIDIDEVDCPHCAGRGTTGLIGDLCRYCRGSQVVTKEMHDEYDPEQIDEVDCPHCGGRGTTGLNSEACAYCRGSQVVTKEMHDEYDPEQIDEVDCPHCGGRETTGLINDSCKLCKGSCTVTHATAEAYSQQYGRR